MLMKMHSPAHNMAVLNNVQRNVRNVSLRWAAAPTTINYIDHSVLSCSPFVCMRACSYTR